MTSCSQNRHATAALYFECFFLKEVGFEPTMENPTNLQFATLNRSVIPSYQQFLSEIQLFCFFTFRFSRSTAVMRFCIINLKHINITMFQKKSESKET